MILTMEVKKDNMESAAKYGYMNATDAADYLVSKGIPFRDCHEIIGKIRPSLYQQRHRYRRDDHG